MYGAIQTHGECVEDIQTYKGHTDVFEVYRCMGMYRSMESIQMCGRWQMYGECIDVQGGVQICAGLQMYWRVYRL